MVEFVAARVGRLGSANFAGALARFSTARLGRARQCALDGGGVGSGAPGRSQKQPLRRSRLATNHRQTPRPTSHPPPSRPSSEVHHLLIRVASPFLIRRSVRAGLPHTAPTLDVDGRTLRRDTDAGSSASAASACRLGSTCSRSIGGRVGCVGAARGAIFSGARRGIAAGARSCPAPRNNGASRETRLAATRRPAESRHACSAAVSPSDRPAWPGISSATFCGGS